MFYVNYLQKGDYAMNSEKDKLEMRVDALEKKMEKMETTIEEILQHTLAKNLRIESIENLSTDIDDRLMTVDDNVESIKDSFENMDKKLDILATLLMPDK